MKTGRWFSIICLFAALGVWAEALDPGKPLSQYILRNWGTEEGLPSPQVLDVLQDRNGFLWLATYNGLARFDGVSFEPFNEKTHPGIRHSSFCRLCEDADGTLWAANDGGGLYRLRQGEVRIFTDADGLADNSVRTVFRDRQGALWAGCSRGLCRKRPAEDRFDCLPAFRGHEITEVFEDARGDLWIGTFREGIRVLTREGRLVQPPVEKAGEALQVTAFAQTPDGTVWVAGAEGGLFHNRGGVLRAFTGWADGQPHVVRALTVDPRGTLWVGCDDGVTRLGKDGFAEWSRDSRTARLRHFWSDREGNLWLATYYAGLSCLSNGKFLTWTTREGLSEDLVHAVGETARGEILVGTEIGLDRLAGGVAHPYPARVGKVRDILTDRKGRTWVATHLGLVILSEGAPRTLTQKEGLSDDLVRVLLEDRSGAVWAGTRFGLSRISEKGIELVGARQGLTSEFILSLLEDRDGAIWIGTSGGGLFRYAAGGMLNFTTRNGLASNVVTRMHQDPDGTLWIGTNNGLTRYRGGAFRTVRESDGLPGSVIFQVLDDGLGFFWMTSPTGVFRVERKSLDAYLDGRVKRITCMAFGKSDGMKVNECTSLSRSFRSRDGRLWFCTLKGVAMIDPARFVINPEAPPIRISQVTVDDADHPAPFNVVGADGSVGTPQPETIVVGPGLRRIEFRFAALSFVAPERVRFRYVLEGNDTAWVEAGTRRAANYTNLGPGRYTFRVMACNNDGVWSPRGEAVRVEVRPFFHQTVWFWALCLLGAALAIGLSIGWRVRSLVSREKTLEHNVEQKTRELREANLSLEAQNRALAEKNAQLDRAYREIKELGELKTSFLAAMAHEVRTPITSVLGFAHLIEKDIQKACEQLAPAADDEKSRWRIRRIHENLRIVIQEGERLTRLISDELELVKIESGKMVWRDEDHPVAEVLAKAVRLARGFFPAAEGVELRYECGADLGVVRVDEDRILHVLSALLDNSARYTQAGHVRLSGRRREDGAVEIAVEDTGPGIPEEHRDKLFDKFSQLGDTLEKVRRGTGLGLAVCREIVRHYGGEIWVEGDPDQGNIFKFTLPVREGA